VSSLVIQIAQQKSIALENIVEYVSDNSILTNYQTDDWYFMVIGYHTKQTLRTPFGTKEFFLHFSCENPVQIM